MRQIENEQAIQTENAADPVNDYIPLAFYGYDDPDSPGIIAYTVNSPSAMPYRSRSPIGTTWRLPL